MNKIDEPRNPDHCDIVTFRMMSHATFIRAIAYVEGLKHHKSDDVLLREKPLRLESIGKVFSGNPPSYADVRFTVASYNFEEAVEHNRNALKGLMDIVYSVPTKPAQVK